MTSVFCTVFNSPVELLNNLTLDFEKRPRQSNIIYPHALKLAKKIEHGESIAPGQFWIACYSYSSLDFVLSCTEGTLGSYPIFLYCNHDATTLTSDFLQPRMDALVQTLRTQTPPSRVFSVFSISAVTKAFTAEWSAQTGIQIVNEDPWYEATSSYCTLSTFKGARRPSSPNHVLRLATLDDLDQCAMLCQEFAATSPPFVLSESQARDEATELITHRQLWVYELPLDVRSSNKSYAISTIVAVTRNSPTVSAITKVYTTAKYRKRGCADRLVAQVTKQLLQRDAQKSVVLYVGHKLDAVRVYNRVGFVGLEPNTRDSYCEDWLELGLQGATLGHW